MLVFHLGAHKHPSQSKEIIQYCLCTNRILDNYKLKVNSKKLIFTFLNQFNHSLKL